jgi:hypothetical protein
MYEYHLDEKWLLNNFKQNFKGYMEFNFNNTKKRIIKYKIKKNILDIQIKRHLSILSRAVLDKKLCLNLDQIKTVQIHNLNPCLYKVLHKLLRGIFTCVDFCQRPELGVRTEYEVDASAGPL